MTKAEKTNQSNAICGNCGATAGGAYCPVCGQDTKLGPPTVAEYSHELIAHFIHLDGKILRTLGTLFFAPGKLPNDYLANKRARYVRPLRLYLAMIAIAFTVVQFLRWDLGLRFGGHRFNFLHVPRTAQDRSSADTVPLVLEYIDTPGIRHLKALSPEEQLTSSQLGQLLRELREDKASYFGHLTYHLATALFFTGCRYHEWALLTIDRLCASREE